MRKSLRSKDGLVFYPAHNPKVVSSNLTPATILRNTEDKGLLAPEQPFLFSADVRCSENCSGQALHFTVIATTFPR